MSAIQLSVVVITKNEAGHIADCLKSVPFADEWVVLDSASSDATRAIAQGLGARVEASADWPGFGAQKNRALALAQGQWVLSIDADERVSAELAREIVDALQRERVAPTGVAGFELSRLSRFCGQWMHHGDWYPDRVLRLFRRGSARFSDDLVHERLLLDGPVQRLRGELLHETMPTLHDALDKMNRYSTGRAIDKLRGGASGGLGAALAHGVWAFVRCYVLKRGFLDGRLGFVLAVYVAEGTYYRYLKMATPISAES
jgi:glycosyltransferase involved in cell wall biosynthesis